jgi:hypothetical protein
VINVFTLKKYFSSFSVRLVEILYVLDVGNNIITLPNAMMEKTGEKFVKTQPISSIT